ncbi:MAG: RNA polymerase sigma factor [Hyphomicrobiaceae bacterium]
MDAEPSSDLHLALAAAGGDAAAFEALIERNYDLIYRLAWRFIGHREAAEDVAQTVCIKLADAIHAFRGESALRTWIYRITYNATVDHIRQHQRMAATEPSQVLRLANEVLPTVPSPEEELLGSELWGAVRALPDQQRDAVLLVYAEDMSHAEAARTMGVSEKTVSWHIHAARKRLKTMLESQS